MRNIISCFIAILVFLAGCKYQKGEAYVLKSGMDIKPYLITSKGKWRKVSDKLALFKTQHAIKGNNWQINCLSDSNVMKDHKWILLSNTILPDISDDILSKGFFGTFTSKQEISYHLVTYDDFDKYFKETDPKN